MFFEYRVLSKTGKEKINLANATINMYETKNAFVKNYAEEIKNLADDADASIVCESIVIEMRIPDDIKAKVNNLGEKYTYNDEAYYIEADKETIIYGETERAVIHALSTVKRLILEGELSPIILFDYPAVSRRGYHAFIPGREQIASFKEMIDNMLVYYKYNYIIFEVGGAMEYKRHPKINEEWIELCKILLAESGTADRLQHHTFPWAKNAMHPDNGGGSYITQDELKELISYCRERGLDVIPEIPSLAHSDYIVRAYPEINERAEDPYPDTYCPSHPKTYEIMYDIIDEVAEVFEGTEYIDIAHDELVTLCICDRCKDKDPASLFAEEITKLYDYITKKGFKVMMYGDKFTKFYKDGLTCEEANGEGNIDELGKPRGGLQGYDKTHPAYVPATYEAYSMIPKDIAILDWYWSYNQFDDTFKDRDVFYANFSAYGFKNWKNRIFCENIKGVSASNWGRNDYIHMQRNNINFTLISTAYACWSKDYDDDKKPLQLEKCVREQNSYYRGIVLKERADKSYIDVCHTTDYFKPYHWFYDGDFVVEEEFRLGDYVIEYTDGSKVNEPVIYGKNISNNKLDITKHTSLYLNVSGATVPEKIDGDMYYHYRFENPHADKEIKSITYVSSEKFNEKTTVKEIKY